MVVVVAHRCRGHPTSRCQPLLARRHVCSRSPPPTPSHEPLVSLLVKVWKGEAFRLWVDLWASLYDDESKSAELLHEVHDTYYLVAVVDNNFIDGNLWQVCNVCLCIIPNFFFLLGARCLQETRTCRVPCCCFLLLHRSVASYLLQCVAFFVLLSLMLSSMCSMVRRLVSWLARARFWCCALFSLTTCDCAYSCLACAPVSTHPPTSGQPEKEVKDPRSVKKLQRSRCFSGPCKKPMLRKKAAPPTMRRFFLRALPRPARRHMQRREALLRSASAGLPFGDRNFKAW